MQHAQQFRLKAQGQLANLIEKNRAALRLLKDSLVLAHRTGIGAFFMAKEHVFHQLLWNRSAVQTDKRPRGAGRGLVNDGCQHLLARARWPGDQGGYLGLGYALGQGHQLLA